MKVGIIGAGVSGLAAGQLLKDKFQVEILEKNSNHGGIARTRSINDVTYHVTGGHCFNSKYPEVLDFVFSKILPIDQWNKIERKAKIKFKDHLINYPIEFSVKEINLFDNNLASSIVRDFLNTNSDEQDAENLEIWFRNKFGNTLAEEYFIPYNKKIWNSDLKKMSPNWVKDKLPLPNKETFFQSLFSDEKDKMPHSNFYYPKSNNQNTFIDKLSEGLIINYDTNIVSIEKTNNGKWLINNEFLYDLIINTSPLKSLSYAVLNCPLEIKNAASGLKYNKVTTMLWETNETDCTWTYLPSSDSIFHRYIHIGNFFVPKKNYTITEAVGVRSYDEMVENGKKDPFLISPIDYHVSDHAYVVFDDSYRENKNKILTYFNSLGIHNLGRFAEWEYYNMDICILQALKLSDKIILNNT